MYKGMCVYKGNRNKSELLTLLILIGNSRDEQNRNNYVCILRVIFCLVFVKDSSASPLPCPRIPLGAAKDPHPHLTGLEHIFSDVHIKSYI